MKLARVILAMALAAAAFLAGYGYGRWYGPKPAMAEKKVTGYHCPMHPGFRSPHPGDCGICGMRLVPDDEPEIKTVAREGRILHYRDAHDHSYMSDKPGVNPATGNDLEPVYADTIALTPEQQQAIGVRFEAARPASAVREIRASGKVMADERRVAKIQSRVDGWVERVMVDYTGRAVKAGEPLLTLYSPELVAAEQEYLLALRSREVFRQSPVAASGESLVSAARRRLELLDLTNDQIREIERTGQPIKNITIYSPASGYVAARNAFPRQRITPETELYTVADLSRVWIVADVFENEAGEVREGMEASVTLPYAGLSGFRARVTFIQPQMDAMTRTLKVRLEADNPGQKLKPEMFADVTFRSSRGAAVTVAADAVLDSGTSQRVFVDAGDGRIEPREVVAGETFGDRVEILSGLKAGERVAVSGNFLLDSESRLKAAAKAPSTHGARHD